MARASSLSARYTLKYCEHLLRLNPKGIDNILKYIEPKKEIPLIKVIVIEHDKQRYDTCGDWLFDEKHNLCISVSRLNKLSGEEKRYCHFLVAIHEMIEAYLCEANGVKEEEVSQWDKDHPNASDPGSIPGAPYYKEHLIATLIERMLADELDVDWDEYGEAIEAL